MRKDLAHLKWMLINHKGLSPKDAQRRIEEVMKAEHIDKEHDEKLNFKEEFKKLTKHEKYK